MARLDKLDHIVVLMMENRSFDHVLGHLSLGGRPEVDGLRADAAWKAAYTNPSGEAGKPGVAPATHRLESLPFDPPHGRAAVKTQFADEAGEPSMRGFVRAAEADGHGDDDEVRAVMSYQDADDVWVYSQLAAEFGISDRWFASVPTSTMPNRMMYMCGQTRVEETGPKILPNVPSVFEWLSTRETDAPLWRYYFENVPYYSLLPHRHVGNRIQRRVTAGGTDRFRKAWKSEDPFPTFCFLDPNFYLLLNAAGASDDHPHHGSRMLAGQNFVRDIYDTLLSNPARFARTLFLVTYDEHGGLFDHVAPPRIKTSCGSHPAFERLGVRVPLFAVSPYVGRGALVRPADDRPFDHVSILKLIVEKVGGPADDFVKLVQGRDVASATELLTLDEPRNEPWKAPPRRKAVETPVKTDPSPLAAAFVEAVSELRTAMGADELEARIPGAAALLEAQATLDDLVGQEGPVGAAEGAEEEAGGGPGEYPSSTFFPAGAGHYRKPAQPRTIDRIVLHVTDGPTAAGAIAWFQTGSAHTAAHYVIDRDGTVYQMVKHADIAYHAVGANRRSIGIEHAAVTPAAAALQHRDPMPATPAQYAASAKLVAWLCKELGLPRDREHIKGHREVGTTSHQECPDAAWDWDAFLTALAAEP